MTMAEVEAGIFVLAGIVSVIVERLPDASEVVDRFV